MDISRGFVLAGTSSGSGKTTVSLGMMAWLRKQGFRVAPFKVGPDFIDPGHHTRITGVTSRNLDGWMLSREYNEATFRRGMENADIAVVEGVMGLYDGHSGTSDAGSTAQMAKWLDLPVVLVVNAKSMARSAAALVQGFVNFDRDLKFAGIIFNNLGSKNHYKYLTDAMAEYVSVPVLGGILRNESVAIPERHLGLVTGDEHMLKNEDVDRLAGLIDSGVDTERLFSGLSPGKGKAAGCGCTGISGLKIGVARDRAFCFYYRENLELLEKKGAELVYFSPMNDKRLPKGLSGIYFGGGYPEVFAGKLAENQEMLGDIKAASDRGMPIYGECGGFMYLCREIIDGDGRAHSMTGCFPMATRLLKKLKSLGYREVTMEDKTPLGPPGTVVRGHEFHYSEIVDPDGSEDLVDRAYSVKSRIAGRGFKEGFQVNRTLGSYVHLHFGSSPGVGEAFIKSCMAFGEK